MKKYKRNKHLQYETNTVEYRKNAYLISVYGITLDEYNQLLIKQDFSCAICNIHQSQLKKTLSVDHDHNTGKVRGLLCHNCNHALGKLQDDPIIIQSAIDYLKNFKK